MTRALAIKRLLPLLLLGWGALAKADETVDICYNYGCKTHALVNISNADLERMGRRFQYVSNPKTERLAIALTIGELAGIAGKQTPIRNDKGGNGGDESTLDGKMDCYDHAASNTSYLQLMEKMHWLKFHNILHFVERAPLLFNYHRSASIEDTITRETYVVDDWFFDNGEPAAIFPLAAWQAGVLPEELGSDGIYVKSQANENAALAQAPNN
ncbi:hypothetical protein LIN78_00180 [Leeia sp. TBRC 13508]|uniref:Uncharacterized protein n=1 Tax=Leeia speluncae TaxID=2884804 RepID=A0ABS8D1A1_9NEIS|nr:hypothetical protein [Leeia speluncae]MCB6181972.1 hypothetical protein [Leeia speluncae]